MRHLFIAFVISALVAGLSSSARAQGYGRGGPRPTSLTGPTGAGSSPTRPGRGEGSESKSG